MNITLNRIVLLFFLHEFCHFYGNTRKLSLFSFFLFLVNGPKIQIDYYFLTITLVLYSKINTFINNVKKKGIKYIQ